MIKSQDTLVRIRNEEVSRDTLLNDGEPAGPGSTPRSTCVHRPVDVQIWLNGALQSIFFPALIL